LSIELFDTIELFVICMKPSKVYYKQTNLQECIMNNYQIIPELEIKPELEKSHITNIMCQHS